MHVQLKRIYDPPSPEDGYRILVDRLWPRGVRKDAAELDVWLKDVAPSTELRTWWDHDPARMGEFAQRYRTELDGNPALGELRELAAAHPVVTLLYSAHDPKLNQAVVLREILEAAT